MADNKSDMVKLWEEMGMATGSMIGRFIGLGAQMTLDMFNNFVVEPAKSMENAQGGTDADKQQGDGVRAKTWGEMGQKFGQSMGEFVGTGMDMLVKTVDASVMQPMSQVEKQQSEGQGS